MRYTQCGQGVKLISPLLQAIPSKGNRCVFRLNWDNIKAVMKGKAARGCTPAWSSAIVLSSGREPDDGGDGCYATLTPLAAVPSFAGGRSAAIPAAYDTIAD
jgi:hypothetical protein